MSNNISIFSSLPRTEFRGYSETGLEAITQPVPNKPIRLPLLFTFAGKGGYTPKYVNNSLATALFGDGVLDAFSKYYNHQNVFLSTTFTGGGRAMLQRLAAPGVKQASTRLIVDFVADKIPVYETDADGYWVLDAQGQPIPVVPAQTVDGYRLQVRTVEIPRNTTTQELQYAQGVRGQGQMESEDTGDLSVQLPIWDALGRWEGGDANNTGYRLSAPTLQTTEPAEPLIHETLGAYTYRFSAVTRASANSTASTRLTRIGEGHVNVSFKRNAFYQTTRTQFNIDKAIKPAYENPNPSLFEGYAPFEKTHTYHSNLEELLGLLKAAEEAVTGEEIADIHLINFLTGVDINGVPYRSFVVEGPELGGDAWSANTNHFLTGGDDGDVSVEAFNTVVDELLSDLDNAATDYREMMLYPFDSVWDTGFPVETKLKFANFHPIRPDVIIHACTQDVLMPLNTPSQDSSIGAALRSHYRLFDESTEENTRSLRFFVAEEAGYFTDETGYDGIVPFLEYICLRGAQYMGAENGEMTAQYTFGRSSQTVIDGRYRDHNAGIKRIGGRNVDWLNGINFATAYDMNNRLSYKGLQSIHENQSSVYNTYLNVCIAANLCYVGHAVWNTYSGDSQLEDNEFLDLVEEEVRILTAGKYDNRANVVPDAYMTRLDDQLKFRWHLDIGLEVDPQRTVQRLAIISSDRRQLAAGA